MSVIFNLSFKLSIFNFNFDVDNFKFLFSIVNAWSCYNRKFIVPNENLTFSTSKMKLKILNLKYNLKTMLI